MFRILSICLLGVSLAGCGGGPSDMPDLGTVSGVVTVGGKPLSGAIVNFTPEGPGRPSSGVTDADGSYELQYTAENAGAAIGKHIVTVTAPVAESDYESSGKGNGDNEEPNGGLPAAASDRSLKTDVVAGANTFDIKL